MNILLKYKSIFIGGLAVVVLAVAVLYLVPIQFGKSAFQLMPERADAAGIAADSGFILKSSERYSVGAIQKAVRIDPPADFTVTQKDAIGKIFGIKPKKSLETDTVYSIAISDTHAQKEESWAYQVKSSFQVVSTIPASNANSVPPTTGIEFHFNRAIPSGATIELTPKVPGKYASHDDTLVFVPQKKLDYKTVYTATVKAGIESKDGERLTDDSVVRFETDAPPAPSGPSFSFSFRDFLDFNPGEQPTFLVWSEKMESVPLTVYRFSDSDEFAAMYRESTNALYSWTSYHAKNPLPLENKKIATVTAKIEGGDGAKYVQLPKSLEEGWYLVEYDTGSEPERAWVQVSPLKGFYTLTGGKSLVWMKDAKGVGVSGASIDRMSFAKGGEKGVGHFSYTTKKDALGSTDEHGVNMFDTPASFISKESYPSKTDQVFLALRKDAHILLLPVGEPTTREKDTWWTALTVDKPIYHPSDTLKFWGVMKRRDGTGIQGNEVTVAIRDPYATATDEPQYAQTKIKISPFSTVTGELSFVAMKPGYYSLDILYDGEVVLSQGIMLQTYVKPAYFFELSPDKPAVFEGDPVRFHAKASFYDGSPVSRLGVTHSTSYNGKGGTAILDAKGEADFTVSMTTAGGSDASIMMTSVSPAVAEEGEISASTGVTVFPSTYNLAIRTTVRQKETNFDLTLNAVDISKTEGDEKGDAYMGAPAAGRPLEVSVTRVTYKESIEERRYDPITKETYPIYHYQEIRTPVHSTTLTTDSAGHANFVWHAEKDANFDITFTSTDEKKRQTTQKGFVWELSSNRMGAESLGVSLVNDNAKAPSYAIGDEVSLTATKLDGSLIPEKSQSFLFMKSVNGLVSYAVSDVPHFKDVFTKDSIPNAEYTLVWFSGRRYYFPHSWNGSMVSVSVNLDERALDISLQPDKKQYRPRDTVRLGIDVKDKSGKPRQVQINVSGIDEALSAFGSQNDVLSTLYATISTNFVSYTSHESPLDQSAEGGGCFLAGTPVKTPGGSRPIEMLRAGDEVLTHATADATAWEEAIVTKATSHLAYEYMVVNEKLYMTPNHRIFANGEWTPAGVLKVGDTLLRADGTHEAVVQLQRVSETTRVYNIEISPSHTFFANDIYVHNQEKGGGSGTVREKFKDDVIYTTSETNEQGHADVSFVLPDNLTSWRVTANALTKDLYAGQQVEKIPVNLPFFVDATLNTTYLAGDSLLLRVRTFGTAAITGPVTYSVEADTLPFKKKEFQGAAVGEISLGALPAGMHVITIRAKAGEYQDAIKRTVTVLSTYYTKTISHVAEVSANEKTSTQGGSEGYTTLSVCSCSRNNYFSFLSDMSSGGVRLDAKAAAILAQKMLNESFGEEEDISSADLASYQKDSGGFGVVKQGGEDLVASAMIAQATREYPLLFDKETLRSYLEGVLSDSKADIHRSAIAFFGLAALRAPDLALLQQMKNDSQLTTLDKAYVALALESYGDKTAAREIYASALRPKLITQDPLIFVRDASVQDENIQATMLIGLLAERLREPEVAGLSRYAFGANPQYTSIDLERTLYVKSALPHLSSEDARITYTLDGEKKTLDLSRNKNLILKLTPEQLKNFDLEVNRGKASIASEYDEKTDVSKLKQDAALSIDRTYVVKGKKTTVFKEGDLVKVELMPHFTKQAHDGGYEITDYLPSGLRLLSDPASVDHSEDSDSNALYPEIVDNQRVVFWTWKNAWKEPHHYYARVVSKGTYRAESPMVQSLSSRESLSIMPSSTEITIQ
ncbi:MAG: Ig-like domain-containing protein [bacterium]|nr:Ig-like domain-containing protein [bacterium]